ncbi:hypothetical protein E3N88_35653 [Mikania micrantha]|uniref:Reverse transcriptase zinc-binding domain-containing protein n=1 Tax=Mikania micrantha TaxID=192012 RepID=A0A5N6M4B8_9ASTR|nr:hypothetical protein E3N88_35653 [Mikania micrantha]
MFWCDLWLGTEPFCVCFPALFSIETRKGCVIADRVKMHGDSIVLDFQWSSFGFILVEENELDELSNLIKTCKFNNGMDRWCWNMEKDGVFSVQSIKGALLRRLAQLVWEKVSIWCKLQPMIVFSLHDLVDLSNLGQGSKKWKNTIHAVIVTTLWSIWKIRNKIIFESKSLSTNNLFEEIKTLSFLWVKNRAKFGSLSWEQ